MIESALIESLNKNSLNRSRTLTTSELHNDYASNKKSTCLSTPSLSSESSIVVEPNRLLSSGSDKNNDKITNTPRMMKTSSVITGLNNNHRVLSNKLTKFRISCKSSNYNSKDIANNLYDIDDHLNKDLIYDYFFNDNYMLDCLTPPNSNNYSCVNTFKENNYNNNNTNVNNTNNNNNNIGSNQPWVRKEN